MKKQKLYFGYSLYRISKMAKLPWSVVDQAITGNRNPRLKTAKRIAKALERSIDDIWG